MTTAAVNAPAPVRPPQPAPRPPAPHAGAHPGHSFAQALQGAAEETDASAELDGADDEQTSETESAEHRDSEDKKATHGSADDALPNPAIDTPQNILAARGEKLMALRRASLLAAARGPGRAEAPDAGAASRARTTLEGDERDAKGLATSAAAGKVESAPGIDISGMQPTLGATPVQLAPAPMAAAAGSEGNLPSLSVPGEAPSLPSAPAPEAAPPGAAQASLAPPPGSAAFPAALGAQLSTWLRDGVQFASLALNPQDMGPIDVRIALRDGVTQVELAADVEATRAALAEALPALAESLGDVGLSLSGGSVSDQTGQHARDSAGQGQRSFGLPSWMAAGRDGAEPVATRPGVNQRGLIDLVA